MNYISKRHIIKIPKNIDMYYCDSKHTIIFANSLAQKVLILKTKVIIEEENRIIKITREPFSKTSNNEKKKVKSGARGSSKFLETNALRYFPFFL